MRSYLGFRSTYLSCIAIVFAWVLMSTVLSGCSKQDHFASKAYEGDKGQASQVEMAESEGASVDALSQNQMASQKTASPEAKKELDASSEPSDSRSAPSPVSGQAASILNQPQIIKTANLSLEVKEMEPTLDTLHHLVKTHRGLFTNETIALAGEAGGYRSAQLEIRIPQENLDSFLKGVKGVGTIRHLTVTGEDVGAEMVDNASRIKNLKAEEAALQEVMKRAGKIPEVLEVARELARVRGEIEEAQGRLNFLKQQVAYSTVHLNLSEQSVSSASSQKPGWDTVMANSSHQVLDALDGIVRLALTLGVWAIAFFLPVATLVIMIIYGFVRLLIGLLRKLFHSNTKPLPAQAKPAAANDANPEPPSSTN
jgi:hypothetical protein